MKFKTEFSGLPLEQLEKMQAAGQRIEECYRVLRKANANVVGQCLANQGKFVEYDHYPKGDIFDGETKSQYYYHAHRKESGEHGHFHTFVRAGAMPDDIAPLPYDGDIELPSGKDAICHLVAVSMNGPGYPIGLFSTNRWVTGETFYSAEDAIRLIDKFLMDHTYPCLAANRWISAMICLFRPQIEVLLMERDRVIADWQKKYPDRDVYEDRELELTSILKIDVKKQCSAVEKAVAKLS